MDGGENARKKGFRRDQDFGAKSLGFV